MPRRAKIVATLGPASARPRILERMLKAGVDVVRLNLSHGTADEHRAAIRRVRETAERLGRQVPVLVDLMGPRFRLGRLEDGPRRLNRGQRVTLGPPGADCELPVDDPSLPGLLEPGERLLVDNGLVELVIESKRGGRLVARVVTGGPVDSRKGINLPDSRAPFTISDKDRADIALAVAEGADFLGASYVGEAADLEALRAAARELGGTPPLVAKLERGRAVKNLDAIATAADALMVARGDLGVEVPLHRVPVLQKKIIDAGRRFGKPVIVATQMLESMVERPRPTRAESSDVANAVFDGADALMLSGETAVGRHPVEAVRTMARIIREAESYQRSGRRRRAVREADRGAALAPGGEELEPWARGTGFEIADVVSAAAVFAARHLGARQVVAFSQGGFTARMIARYRPAAAIRVFTNDPATARRIELHWGVRSTLIDDEVEHHEDVVRLVDDHLRTAGLAKPGETLVILMGHPIRDRPLTNLMRIHRVES